MKLQLLSNASNYIKLFKRESIARINSLKNLEKDDRKDVKIKTKSMNDSEYLYLRKFACRMRYKDEEKFTVTLKLIE